MGWVSILSSMLPRTHRLNFRFNHHRMIFKTGRRYRRRTLEVAFDYDGDVFQAGVLIPKRYIPHSSHRNALRRRILQAIPHSFQDHPKLRLAIRVVGNDALRITAEEIASFFEELAGEILI